MNKGNIIGMVLLGLILLTLIYFAFIHVHVIKWERKRKEVKFNKAFKEKISEIANEKSNRELLRATYFASLNILRYENLYVDPEFTIYFQGRAVKIRSSEIVNIMLKNKQKELPFKRK